MKLRIVTPKAHEPWAIKIVKGNPCPIMVPALRSVPEIVIHRADEFANVKRFHESVTLELDQKKLTVIKDADDNVIDYQNVRIAGYLSTFKGTTPSDRQGDYVEPGAFKDTLKKFMSNPVLLVDHRNTVDNLVGQFTKMSEDKTGLKFEAVLSNAPGLADIRFKVAEGMLQTCSMGGVFHYLEDGRGIFRVELWEGSLVSIPANADAMFQVRALSDADKKYLSNQNKFASYYHFLEAEQLIRA